MEPTLKGVLKRIGLLCLAPAAGGLFVPNALSVDRHRPNRIWLGTGGNSIYVTDLEPQ